VLTDLKQFMSSDYLLAGLGYNPDESVKRLGDGLYEQRLVQQAVTSRTGQAFIDGQTSNEDQFKYLMNNAIASKNQLNLSVGVSLTSEQVAALTHDIVWLEEREVNGETVLVPVLYLAQADGRLAPNGALIAGKDVTLIAGQNLDNVGTLKATNNLSATAGNDLVNSGLISAGNRLDLLAGNDVTNKAGGIIAGRDVTVTAIGGDVTNERSVTSLDSDVRGQLHKEYADNAARIEAANDLSVSAGRDINNIGSTLQAGRDMTLNAGRDVNTAATQLTDSLVLNSKHTSSDITQIGSTVSAGRDLSVQAGRDINAIASQIDAKRDIAMAATEDVTISSAADEEHSYSKSKKVKKQEDHVSQVQTEITAGGSVAVSAGQNLAVTSSRIAANDEAYLAAGNKLEVLAAQDNDYSLYDMKKKGSFGSKKTKHDEVTQVTNVSSEISAGGNLVLVSGGDQTYQVAKLNSGKDLTINSGGAVNFEGVKDLHQENHSKSNTSLAWNSMSGKGKTDETLRQSELIAKGGVAIDAVDGLHIEVKQVNQQTVSQAIDAMVKADPDLAWLKDAEKRGDVDWKLIKETHDAYKYSNSSLGQGAMLAIIIIVTVLTAGAASGAVGAMASAQAGTTMAAATAGTAATATAAATAGTAAGLGNIMATAALTSMASTAAVSVINNKGNLGATVKDITSSQSIKGYLTSAAMAGVMPGYDPASLGFNLSSAQVVLMKSASDAFVNTVINGGNYSENLGNALVGQASNIGMAMGFKMIGDWALGKYAEGSPQKVMAHALVGGLLAEATGGDFKTGAAAAGANEALINVLSSMVGGDKSLEVMASKLTGLVAAAAVGGDVAKGAEIAQYATTYNRQLHVEEQKWLEDNAKTFADKYRITEQAAMERLSQQALKDTDMLWRSVLGDGTDSDAQTFLAGAGQTFTNDLGNKQQLFTAAGNQIFRPEMFADTADPSFYIQFVQSGISRDLSSGLIKELKDSGIALKDGAVGLYDAANENPGAVFSGILSGLKNVPEGAYESFLESGKAIGEGAAVASNADIADKLNAIYGQDVSAAQQALLAIRILTAVSGAKLAGSASEALTGKVTAAVTEKLRGVLDDLAEQTLIRSGGAFGSDGLPLLDLSKLTNQQKGSLGELLGENTVKQIIPDGIKIARAPAIGETGLDDLYKINNADVDFVVVEYKFVGSGTGKGSTRLGDTLDGGQASDGWILGGGRLEKSVGDDMASAVKSAMLANRTETWVVTTRPDGSSIVEVLDSFGKAKSVDTSKILSARESLTGAQL
jgi:filamentous hemagglutinin